MKKTTPNTKIQIAGRISLELYAYVEKVAKRRELTISSAVSYLVDLGIKEDIRFESLTKSEKRIENEQKELLNDSN